MDAHAYCTILGSEDNVAEPKGAHAFLKDRWSPVKAGDVVDVPPNTLHGFTVEPNGILYFLSLQSPPIERGDGHDDYIRAENTPKPF